MKGACQSESQGCNSSNPRDWGDRLQLVAQMGETADGLVVLRNPEDRHHDQGVTERRKGQGQTESDVPIGWR